MARRHKGEGSIHQRHVKDCPRKGCRCRWAATLEVGYGPSGRRRRTVTAKTKRELEPKLKRLREEVAAGITGEQWTVESWVRHWHQRISSKSVSPRTHSTYGTYIEQYIVPHLGKVKLPDLKAGRVRTWLDTLEDEGLSPRTRQQAYAVLRRAMAIATNDQHVLRNVVALVERPAAESKHHPALEVPQARGLIAGTAGSAERARLYAALLLGLRQGEALGLLWADVHLDDPVPWVLIHQVAQRQKGAGVVIKPTTKTGKARSMALVGPLSLVADALREYRTEHGGVGYVWRGDKPVSPERDHAIWKDALAAAGLPPLPLHGARATAESWLEREGVPRRTISDILGHALTQTTDTHYHRVTIEAQAHGLTRLTG